MFEGVVGEVAGGVGGSRGSLQVFGLSGEGRLGEVVVGEVAEVGEADRVREAVAGQLGFAQFGQQPGGKGAGLIGLEQTQGFLPVVSFIGEQGPKSGQAFGDQWVILS